MNTVVDIKKKNDYTQGLKIGDKKRTKIETKILFFPKTEKVQKKNSFKNYIFRTTKNQTQLKKIYLLRSLAEKV